MARFSGFPAGKTRLTPLPAAFFSELLAQIDDLAELKVTLYAFWFLDRQEGNFRYVAYEDFAADADLLAGLGENAPAALKGALEKTVERGTLLQGAPQGGGLEQSCFFLNSARGRAALAAWQSGEWSPQGAAHAPVTLAQERPNIFRLYEENIGPLTPLIADELRQAEQDYPPEWIEDAIRQAVESNARKWRYVQAVLKAWKEKGHGSDRGNSEEDRRRYIEGEFGKYVEH